MADYASPWQRLAAAIVDGLVLAVPFGILTFLFAFDTDQSAGTFDVDPPLWLAALTTVATAAYHVVGTALWGQTVGKRLMGIRVCSASDRQLPGWSRAVRRWGTFLAVALIPFVGQLLSLLIPLPLLWTKARQGVHDMVAGTVVVKTSAAPAVEGTTGPT